MTGGAGFLGSHLCTRLLDAGAEVDCLDNLSTGRAEKVAHLAGRPGFRFLERDISAPGCADALTGPYDLVLHLAGPASPAARPDRPVEALDAGSLGTRTALSVAGRDGARFLLASSPPAGPAPAATPRTTPTRSARTVPAPRPSGSPRPWSPHTRAPTARTPGSSGCSTATDPVCGRTARAHRPR